MDHDSSTATLSPGGGASGSQCRLRGRPQGAAFVVQYDQVQFTKSDRVLSGMGLELGKTPEALAELEEKGLA